MVHKCRLSFTNIYITNNEVKSVQNLPDSEAACECDEALSEATTTGLLMAFTS